MTSGNNKPLYQGLNELLYPKRSERLAKKKLTSLTIKETVSSTSTGTSGPSSSSRTLATKPMESFNNPLNKAHTIYSPQTLPAKQYQS